MIQWKLTKKIAITLYLIAQIFFLIGIQFPVKPNFDEFHYVPAAKQWIAMKDTQNWEHPPLAKQMMAIGIALWGDRPIGWRFMSTVFGAATLPAAYLLALGLFASQELALWVALATMFNNMLYVESRIGMLDPFMFFFILWGLAFFVFSMRPEGVGPYSPRRLLLFTGISFGLATACKWFSVIPWFAVMGMFGCGYLLRYFPDPSRKQGSKNKRQKNKFLLSESNTPAEVSHDWRHPLPWANISLSQAVMALGIAGVTAYFATFLPYLWVENGTKYHLWDLVTWQQRMYDGQLRVTSSHPYMSTWLQWPLITRPIWYAFDRDPADANVVRGVLFIGNPLLMWAGLLALLGCLVSFLRSRQRAPLLILLLYGAFYFCWMLIPRKIAFYYYYYPAGTVLAYALAWCFRGLQGPKTKYIKWMFLGACIGLFIFFFPILSGQKIQSDSFRSYMWFRSWI